MVESIELIELADASFLFLLFDSAKTPTCFSFSMGGCQYELYYVSVYVRWGEALLALLHSYD